MANVYLTLTEMKVALPNLTKTLEDGSQDALLTAIISRASRCIDLATFREPGAYYVGSDQSLFYNGPLVTAVDPSKIYINDILSVTTVETSANGDPTGFDTIDPDTYYLFPNNASFLGIPYQGIGLYTAFGVGGSWPTAVRSIQITGRFGYSTTTPDIVKAAMIIQVGRWFKRAQLAYQDKVAFTDNASQFAYMNAVDRDVEMIVQHLRRSRVGASPN